MGLVMNIPRILAVDNNSASQAILAALLTGEGYTVVIAESGEQALAAVKNERPALILLDDKIPGMGGIDLCRQLTADTSFSDIPVVVMCTAAGYDKLTEMLRYGVADFITKPVNNAELLLRIKTQLSVSRTATKNRADESESKYLELFENSPVGKSMTTIDGSLVPNNALCEMLGYSMAELSMLKWQDLTLPEDIAAIEEQLGPLKKGVVNKLHFEKRYLRKDGSIMWGDVLAYIHYDRFYHPCHFITTIIDITDRKNLEAERESLQSQLFQAQKLEAIGQLASGIAHDFNNMLGGISGYADLLKLKYCSDPETSEYVGKILTSTVRASYLTRQLLTFARKAQVEKRLFDVHASLTGIIDMLERTLGNNICIIKNYPSAALQLYSDQNLLENCMLNLCINARDAMPEGGTLTIATGFRDIGDQTDTQGKFRWKPGQYITIVITDTGTGMDDATMQRVFEPFFTTKAPGKGTGLGLASVYGFVKQHDGYITVDSTIGKGTCFTLYFPATHDTPVMEQPAPEDA